MPSVADVIVIHRLQGPLPISYLCYAILGACFAVDDVGQLLDVPVLLATMVNLLLIVAALALNTAVDINTDKQDLDKAHLPRAILRFGNGRAFRWATTEAASAMALAVLASLWAGRWLIAAVAVAIIASHLLYNLEPVRLKRRGFAGSAAFGISFLVLPCLISYSALRPETETSMWPILAGLGVMITGRTAWFSVPDRTADVATGMTTPAGRYGVGRALAISSLLTLAGLSLLGWGLWWRYEPVWASLGALAGGAFLGGMLSGNLARMRKHAVSLVVAGDLLITAIPLAA